MTIATANSGSSGESGNMTVSTGSATSGVSGGIAVSTGDATSGTTGVSILTGDASGGSAAISASRLATRLAALVGRYPLSAAATSVMAAASRWRRVILLLHLVLVVS